MDIDPETKSIVCESVVCEGNSCTIEDFTVNYDKLIVTVGAQTNTYGIPGVREYCCFLKQVEDAKRVRTAIVNCFERANLGRDVIIGNRICRHMGMAFIGREVGDQGLFKSFFSVAFIIIG